MKKALILFNITFLLSGMIRAQEKTSMNAKDLNSDIRKYISKNYKDFKTTEAYKYDVVFEITILKGGTKENLVFDGEGKFLHKMTEADKTNFSFQTRSTISLKDVESDISKYVKKNYEGYKITEAFRYDEVYTAKVMKGAETEILLFDNKGEFIKIIPVAKPAATVVKTDSVPAKPVQKTDSIPVTKEVKTDSVPVKEEPLKNDSVK